MGARWLRTGTLLILEVAIAATKIKTLA
jgi:hypothetical protein